MPSCFTKSKSRLPIQLHNSKILLQNDNTVQNLSYNVFSKLKNLAFYGCPISETNEEEDEEELQNQNILLLNWI
jgi:hypothetical protein